MRMVALAVATVGFTVTLIGIWSMMTLVASTHRPPDYATQLVNLGVVVALGWTLIFLAIFLAVMGTGQAK